MGDLKKWTVAELKAELEKRELSQAGNKAALVGRLTAAQHNAGEGNQSDGSLGAEDLIRLEDSPVEDESQNQDGSNGQGLGKPGLDQILDDPSETRPEWELYNRIPDNWLPIPLFMVRNIPIKAGVTEEDVKTVLEAAEPGVQVRSVYFDDRPKEEMMNRRTAIVRLRPLQPSKEKGSSPEPEQVLSAAELKQIDSSADTAEVKSQKKKQAAAKKVPPQDGDAVVYSQWIVGRLKAVDPPIQVGGENVQFEHGSPQVQLYIGNLSPEWQQDAAFEKAMSTYGPLERVFIVRNPRGLSKGYGFVEYTLPGAALKCKQAMDEIERDMRPDPKAMKLVNNNKGRPAERTQITEAQKAAGWQEGGGVVVKLLRAEWAIITTVDVIFSRVLYVANLRTSPGSQTQLKDLFSQYGEVQEVSVPKNKQTNTTKGFAFVLFTSGLSADRAYRALETSGSAEIGGALVSFANSAKHGDARNASGSSNFKGVALNYKGNMPIPRHQLGFGRGHPGGRFGGDHDMSRGGGLPGRGFGRGRGGYLEPPMVDPVQQQQIQMQAGLAAQTAIQERMAAQIRMQQAQATNQMQTQFQQQMRQQQLQMQQMQQQLEASQRQIQQVQAKAQAEAEARQKLEAEARRSAVVKPEPIAAKRAPGAYAEGAGGRGSTGGYASYNRAASAAMDTKYGQVAPGFEETGYGPGAVTSQGYGSGPGYASQGFPGPAGGYGASQGGQSGYNDAFGASNDGSGGYGPQDYEGGGYGGYAGAEGGYDSQYDGKYGSGYGYEGGYGGGPEGPGGSGGYAGGHDYSSEYGQGGGSGGGYPAGGDGGYSQGGYGSQSTSGSKRGNPYQGTYGYGGGYGSQGGEGGKRQRY